MLILLNNGFSLIESLIVLGMMAIVLVFSEISYITFYQHSHRQAAIHSLYSDIRFTRNSAVTRGHVMVLCGSSNGYDCDGAWSQGRLIKDIYTHQRLRHHTIHLLPDAQWFWRSSFGRNDYLKFAASGYTLGQQGRFYYCQKSFSMSQAEVIVVSPSGRLRIEHGSAKCASFY